MTRVRPLDPGDAAAWFTLMCEGTQAHPEAFLLSFDEVAEMTPERVESALARGNTYGLFTDEGALIGHAGLHLWDLERLRHRADIGPFYLTASARGTGAAKVFLDALAEAAALAGVVWLDLWVDGENRRARAFYAREGFVEIGRRQDAIRVEGVSRDDVLMTRRLEAPGAGD
ncbi:GNAT family N-acetyltransferase [Jannaschia pohangensis]|uniref:Acetyltransferase (GNAT) domain-containing protein n=1 Tax=Jannaschia pohangensis TaxID=390807 RepID=A0A1I3IUH6_9RHOB|nr:GNAT family protein [Jannaschia pohangensis]SFI51547.1 Acetyltransferase (GNAT) domain-containing protein [Jannaschia pohangensis]